MASQDKSVTLGINLDTAQLKASAESGAAALAQLEDQIKADSKELAQMKTAMRDIQRGNVVDIEQYRKLQTAIEAKTQSIAAARSQHLALGGVLGQTRKSAGGLKGEIAELRASLAQMPGPIGSVTNAFTKVFDVIKKNPMKAAATATAGAMVLLTARTALAIGQLTNYAIAQADAARSERLRLEGLTKIHNYYGVAAGSATELQDAIDKTAGSSALARDKIVGLAEQLYKANFRGQNLADALDAAAIKTATQGQQQANMWIGYAEAINRTGGNVKGFADTVRNQLGGIAQKQMLSADVQAQKLQESYAALTTSIKIEPLLKARAEFNALFSQSTAAGRALRDMLGSLVQPLINSLTRGSQIFKRVFQGMIIGALEFQIAVLEVLDTFGVTFTDELPGALEDTESAIKAGQVIFDAFLAVITAVGVAALYTAITALPALATALWATLTAAPPLLLLAAALWGVYEIVTQLAALFQEDIDWKLLGDAIFEGISSAWDKTVKWIKDLGGMISGTFKEVLGIHSPSRVFAQFGEDIGEGLQQGIDASAPDVNDSVEHLVKVPEAPAGGTGGAAATGAAGNTIVIQEINLSGYAEPAAAANDFVTELTAALKAVGYQLGTTSGAA